MTDVNDGALTNDEFTRLVGFLARYVSHELDQFEHWRIETSYGPVYISMTNALPPGSTEDAFAAVWPLPDRLQSGQ